MIQAVNEIMIPDNKISLIIGKDGETIMQLQEFHEVKMVMIQSGLSTAEDKPLRISGDPQKCSVAIEAIRKLLGDNTNFATHLESNISEVPVSREFVGMVIGKGGKMIRKIQMETGAKVEFFPDDGLTPDKICTVTGSLENIRKAAAMIRNIVTYGNQLDNSEMSKIMDGLYIGNIKDSKNIDILNKNNITHILSIHEMKNNHNIKGIEYLYINAEDNERQDLSMYFSKVIHFIHNARSNSKSILVHCLMGISRSVTLCIAYCIAITKYKWHECLLAIKTVRPFVKPNFGFQRQLVTFEENRFKIFQDLKNTYPNHSYETDEIQLWNLLKKSNFIDENN